MAKKQPKVDPSKKVTLTFTGLSPKAAKTLAEWYEGQGEQQAGEWFDIHESQAPLADVGRKGGCMETDKDGNVTLHCK